MAVLLWASVLLEQDKYRRLGLSCEGVGYPPVSRCKKNNMAMLFRNGS